MSAVVHIIVLLEEVIGFMASGVWWMDLNIQMRNKRLRFSNIEPEPQLTNSSSISLSSQPTHPPHTSSRLPQCSNGLRPFIQQGSSQPQTANQVSSDATPHDSSRAPSRNFSRPQEEENFDEELVGEFEVDMTDASNMRNKRGVTRLADIWNLPTGKKVIVDFNAAQLPVGDGSGVFNRFIGTVARKPHLCPINYNNWRHVPNHYKEDCWNIIESKFEIPEDQGRRDQIKQNTLKSLGEKLKDWRCSLKARYYDPSKTPAQIVAAAPATVNREHYAELVNYWYSEGAELFSEANKQHRANQKGQHTLGSITYSQYAYKMEMKNKVVVSRTALYEPTHTRKDETAVNESAAENIRKIKELMESQSPSFEENTIGKIGWASNDIYSQVIGGKEHHGRVRGLGFGYTPTSCGSTSNNGTRWRVASDEERTKDKEIINELQEKLKTQDNMLNTQAGELNILRTQVEFLLRQSGLQAQDCVGGIRDQASPHMHQVSSIASHEIEPHGFGNRTI